MAPSERDVVPDDFCARFRANVTVMKNKLVPEPPPPVPQKRFVLNIGGEKMALDFGAKVTELKPQPAEVIPVEEGRTRKRAKTKP